MGRWMMIWPLSLWLNSMLPILTFIWIWILTFIFFVRGVNSVSGEVSVFNIIYVTFAVTFIISFQISRDFWQKMIIGSLTLVLVHVVLVLIFTLLHQFNAVRILYENFGINSKWQKDLGLHVFSVPDMILFVFIEIMIILMLVILKVLLHKVNPVATISVKGLEKMIEVLDTFFDITKLTVFGIIMACIARVTAVNFLILIAAVMSMVLRRIFRFIIIQLISITSAVILLTQMIMQLDHFTGGKNVTCVSGNSTVTLNSDTWIGIGKMESDESILHNIVGYFCIIALVTVYVIVIKEENILQGLNQDSGWSPRKMFNDPVYHDGDNDFHSYVKYLFKYGFYHHGIQFTYVFIALLIQARLDFWALVYSIWLVVFILCSDKALAVTWRVFKYFLVIVIPLQYAASLGLWTEICFGYELEENTFLKNVFLWLFLPLGSTKPDAFNLFWDLVVFLFALCQANVFEFGNRFDPVEIAKMSPKSVAVFNPEPVTRRTTTFGLIRYVVFRSLPIVSAIGFFLAATISITIFSLLFGLGFTIILWYADDYFVVASKRTQKLWKYLLIFNVVMIFVKTGLQIPACIFMDHLIDNWCWVVQLFGISCFKTSNRAIMFLKVPIFTLSDFPENACFFHPATIGIEWDIICFIMLIFHDRFLRSGYYTVMAEEAEQNAKFSVKAAKILEELNKKDIKDMQEKYLRNLEKIQKNMKRLEEAQKRIQGIKISEPITHQEAVTSGDYYMFHETDKNAILCPHVDDEEQTSQQEEPESPETPNIGKFIETVMKSDIEEVLKLKETDSSTSDSSKTTPSTPVNNDTELKKECEECKCKEKSQKKRVIISQEMKRGSAPEVVLKSSKLNLKREQKRPTIVLKDEKLQPSVIFSNKTSVFGHQRATNLSVIEHVSDMELISKKGSCNCENCKCKFCFWYRFFRKVFLIMKFIQAFGSSCIVSFCQFCNKLARNYKYIRRQLEIEKYANKDGSASPTLSMSSITEKEKTLTRQLPLLIRLLVCLHDLIMSRFNAVCFLSVLLLQMRNPTIFSLPLAIMVLCWGSLSVPRPSKRFWKVVISYTSVVLLIECIFRSQLIQSRQRLMINNPMSMNRLYGIDRSEHNYTIYYLNIILALFWQRSVLKSIGLWIDIDMPKRRSNLMRSAFNSMTNFFEKLLYNTSNRIPVDVYTHIFICDFVNIFVFIFGFASITEKKEDGVTRYFSENKIPPTLLGIFVCQCLMIFLDRWIYLRRHVIAKLIFQYAQIFLVHFFLFLFLPAIVFKRSNHMFFPSLWYAIKCLYFLLSAYQIRCGYPASVHGHALCQSYNVINLYLYQIYLIFPFVYELRTITDWMWTETTLTLSEWLGMEDIFCTVFTLKCWRNYDNKYSYKRGEKITSKAKFLVGGGLVLLFFFILMFPLGFFTFGYVAGKQNIPEEMELSFRIGSYKPIFKAFTTDIHSLNISEWLAFKEMYRHSPRALTFLSEYYAEDVGIIHFSKYSISEWTIPPIFINELTSALTFNQEVKALTEWKITRKTENQKQPKAATGSHSVALDSLDLNMIVLLMDGIIDEFTINNLSPRFLKVSGITNVPPVEVLGIPYEDLVMTPFENITFQIERSGMTTWWHAYEENPDPRLKYMSASEINQRSDIIIYTFNDKIFPPGIFSYVSAQGIIGMYTTFLISLGFIIRRLCRGRTNQVFLDYIPNVDCILQLLLDIYFVREHKDGKLEEDLYAKLIFLFRSPETLIQWTRMPEESE